MSDGGDGLASLGQLAARQSQLEPLRNRMREFVDDRESVDLERLRERTASGPALSDVVDEDRDDRIE